MNRNWGFAVAHEVAAALAAAQSREELWSACAGQAQRLFGASRLFVGLVSPDGRILHVPYRVDGGEPRSGQAMPLPAETIAPVLSGEVAGTIVDAPATLSALESSGSGPVGADREAPMLPWLVAALRGADRLYGVVAAQWPRPGAVAAEPLNAAVFLAGQTGLVLDRIERERLWRGWLHQAARAFPGGLALVDDTDRVRLATPGFWRTLDLAPPPDGAVDWEAAKLADVVAGCFVEGTAIGEWLLFPKELHRAYTDFHRDGRAIALSVLPIGPGDYGVGRVLILHDRSTETTAVRAGEDVLSMISHELRTPLTSIKGYAQLLRELAPDRSEAEQRALDIIDAQVERLRRLVESLFTVADIDRGQLALHRAQSDVGDLVWEVVQAMRRVSPIHRLRLEAVDALPLADVDPDRVQEVVRHLIDNAVKYSPAGGEIVVVVATRAGAVEVEVRDSGIGIAPHHRERIFERFYQVDRSAARRFSGAGLGLYVCRGIVDAHGGRMWVDSEPDRGSTFGFSLPVVHDTHARREMGETRETDESEMDSRQ